MKKTKSHNNWLTAEQIDSIVKIIIKQCDLIEQREEDNNKNYPDLYDEDYMHGRRHGYTASVLAGFQVNTYVPDMIISKVKYGICHCQPELSSDTVVVQLYSSDATLKTEEIKIKCKKHNTSNSEKHFLVFQFSLSRKGKLLKVDVVDFDCNANEISRKTVFTSRAKIIRISA